MRSRGPISASRLLGGSYRSDNALGCDRTGRTSENRSRWAWLIFCLPRLHERPLPMTWCYDIYTITQKTSSPLLFKTFLARCDLNPHSIAMTVKMIHRKSHTCRLQGSWRAMMSPPHSIDPSSVILRKRPHAIQHPLVSFEILPSSSRP